jgi:hypothetical protein
MEISLSNSSLIADDDVLLLSWTVAGISEAVLSNISNEDTLAFSIGMKIWHPHSPAKIMHDSRMSQETIKYITHFQYSITRLCSGQSTYIVGRFIGSNPKREFTFFTLQY